MSRNADDITAVLQSIARDVRRIANRLDGMEVERIVPEQSYTRREAAGVLRVSTWTIDKARRAGLLVEAEQIGHRDVRITGESILRLHRRKQHESHRQILKL